MFSKHKIICLDDLAVLCVLYFGFYIYYCIFFCFIIKICEQIKTLDFGEFECLCLFKCIDNQVVAKIMHQSIETSTSPPRAMVEDSGGNGRSIEQTFAQGGGIIENY